MADSNQTKSNPRVDSGPLMTTDGKSVKSADGGTVCRCGCVQYNLSYGELPPDLEAGRKAAEAKLVAEGIIWCEESASMTIVYLYRPHPDCHTALHWGDIGSFQYYSSLLPVPLEMARGDGVC